MPNFESVKMFSPAALLSQARSTVLNTLGWMAVLLVMGLISSSAVGADRWIQVMFGVSFAIDFIVFIGAFIFFARTNPDVHRSERFGIQKMAIERGVIGDSASGLFLPEAQAPVQIEGSVTESSATGQIEQKK